MQLKSKMIVNKWFRPFRIILTIHRRLLALSLAEGLMVTIPVAIVLGVKPGKDFLNTALVLTVLYWVAGYFGEAKWLPKGCTNLESKILGGSFFAFLAGPITVGFAMMCVMYKHGFLYVMYGKNVLINAIAGAIATVFCLINVKLMMKIWDRKTPQGLQ